MTTQPNFLFVMVDQQRADWLGCYGHPVVKTPHIDALAATGTRFDEFHVATPICMPNRASFMTGRMPSVNGLRYNGCALPARANTFVDVLRASGYATASIGKSHLQPMTAKQARHSGSDLNGPIAEAWQDDASRYDYEEPARYQHDAPADFPTPYYGFEHVDMVTAHGDKANGHYRQWLRQQHPDWEALHDPTNELPHSYSCPQAYRTPVPEASYPTAYIRDRATDYLKAQAREQPFFCYVSFPDPHHPFNPPGKYWDLYDPEDFALTTRFEDHQNPPPPLLAARHYFDEHGGGQRTPQHAFMATDQHVREAMALTAGMITMIDDAVGELVQTLKDTGQYDNTVIIFNADHGDYLGDFNMLQKGAWAQRSIHRVPMIWSDPSTRAARSTAALASTIDLSATILDRVGVDPYNGMQGQSFLACVHGNSDHRDKLLIEFNDGFARDGFEESARVRTLVNHNWQLSVYKDQDWGELYDLKNDPLQTLNLWHSRDHAPTKAQLFEDLTQLLIGQMDDSPLSSRLA
ncbi:MAG: sulfatase-like hydrolase/transferase [Pseudomonadota bacterium]